MLASDHVVREFVWMGGSGWLVEDKVERGGGMRGGEATTRFAMVSAVKALRGMPYGVRAAEHLDVAGGHALRHRHEAK